MTFITYVFFIVLIGIAWTFVSIVLAMPLMPYVKKHAEIELRAGIVSKSALWNIWAYNLITWLPQPIIVAAVTLATLDRHPDAWKWLYFLVGLGGSIPIGAHKERSRDSSSALMLLILMIVYVFFYFVPGAIPKFFLNIGNWIGR